MPRLPLAAPVAGRCLSRGSCPLCARTTCRACACNLARGRGATARDEVRGCLPVASWRWCPTLRFLVAGHWNPDYVQHHEHSQNARTTSRTHPALPSRTHNTHCAARFAGRLLGLLLLPQRLLATCPVSLISRATHSGTTQEPRRAVEGGGKLGEVSSRSKLL